MKIKNNKKLSILIIVFLALLASLFAFQYFKNTKSIQGNDSSDNSSEVGPTINLSPPTEQELNETEDHKSSLDNQKKPSTPITQSSSNITPIITSADASTVRGYISGISEDGGICTATFRKDAYTFYKESKGFRDANTTVCEPIKIEQSDFSVSGEWAVTLSYSSAMAQGKSEERKFMVN